MSKSITVMEAWIAMLRGKGYRVEEDRIAIGIGFMCNHESCVITRAMRISTKRWVL